VVRTTAPHATTRRRARDLDWFRDHAPVIARKAAALLSCVLHHNRFLEARGVGATTRALARVAGAQEDT